ncbi:MAG: phosphorylase [Janthinobacterium lividum]
MTLDRGGPRRGGPRQASPSRVLVVTGLAFEAAIARRCVDVDVLFGVGPAAAAALQARLQDTGPRPAGIVSFGTAGALDALSQPGDCLLARVVLEQIAPASAGGAALSKTGARDVRRHPVDAGWLERLAAALPDAACVDFAGSAVPVVSATQKHLLHVRTGAAAVDMESLALARVAAAHGLPFVVCRVVIDRASHTLPPAALAGMHADGSTRVLPVIASLLRDPTQLPSLLRLARDAGRARRALTDLAHRMPPGFGVDPAFTTHAAQSS